MFIFSICGPALISEYKSMPLLLNIRACPYLRLQGHALLSEQAFQFEPFQNLTFSVIRACPLMRGNTVCCENANLKAFTRLFRALQ